MNPLTQITAGHSVCATLVKLGITPKAFFWNIKEADAWDVWELEAQPPFIDGDTVPAWTMQELNVMLGGDIPKPDLPETANLKVRTEGDAPNKKTVFIYEYHYYMPKSMLTWQKTIVKPNPGPEASAHVLLEALKNEWTTVEKCNERYKAMFTL